MPEQQWEFCELGLDGTKEHKGKGYSYNVWVRYFGPNESPYYQLAKLDGEIWSFPPFRRAFGLLGAAGWELVSHQFAQSTQSTSGQILYMDIRVAMFKRPIQQGRAVDEPKLIDLIKP